MEFLMNNWLVIILCIAAAGALVYKVIKFINSPSDVQIENLKEWLKLAVTEAEADLGSGTGQLKLRAVYDAALLKFPWLNKYITFEAFSAFVDEALEWMNNQLDSNEKIKTLVVKGTVTPIE